MITYLFEVSFSWLIFYLVYALFLQQERFFGINRGYLLIALIGGLCLPFLQIATTNTFLPTLPILLDEITVGVGQNLDLVEQTQSWSLASILFTVYLVGLVIGLVRFLLSLQKLHHLYKEAVIENKSFYSLVKTSSVHSPFSFGRYLFLSDQVTLNNKEYEYIIEHEITHIRQKHTLDLIGVELLGILFWFNPLLLLYKTALRDQHEFLADQAVLNHVPIKEYGQLLIEQSIPGLKIGLVNHLIYSQLKKRINMMTTKKQSSKIPYLRYALSFSAFLLVFWTVSCQKEIKSGEVDGETFIVVEQMPRFPGCEDMTGDNKSKKKCSDARLLEFIYGNIQYPKKAIEDNVEGMSVVRFVVTKEGLIKNIEVVRSISKECDTEITRIVQTMNDQELRWTPGEQNGKKVNVTYNLPIRFKLKEKPASNPE